MKISIWDFPNWDRDVRKSASHDDLFEACVIREAYGKEMDGDNFWSWASEKKIQLTDQAMVGLNVNEVEWMYNGYSPINNGGSIPITQLEEMYFKLKIYVCDDIPVEPNPSFIFSGCTENLRQKCSRLIFVWTHGGRGINFLDGHGIHLNVSFLNIVDF